MNELYRQSVARREASPSALVRKIGRLTPLSPEERLTLDDLQSQRLSLPPHQDFLRDGEPVVSCFILREGWAIRYILLSDGRRQILSFVLPGDIVGLTRSLQYRATCSAASLTACELSPVGAQRVAEVAAASPLLRAGFDWCAERDASILGDQALRLGRLNAFERVCHLILELWHRLDQIGDVARDGSIDFPLTQSVIADTLGLSVVHVNRQFRAMREEGLVELSQRRLQIKDAERMARLSEFRAHHLQEFRGAA